MPFFVGELLASGVPALIGAVVTLRLGPVGAVLACGLCSGVASASFIGAVVSALSDHGGVSGRMLLLVLIGALWGVVPSMLVRPIARSTDEFAGVTS